MCCQKKGSLVFVCRVGLCGWAKANVPFAGRHKIELKCAVGKCPSIHEHQQINKRKVSKIKNTEGSSMSVGLFAVRFHMVCMSLVTCQNSLLFLSF
jgi:hypothetical protein